MPEKKNQHYVPRFLMRNFGVNKNQINIFHLASKKIIPAGGIKSQCSGDYFYSKNIKIEDAIGVAETEASGVIKEILASDKLPALNSDSHQTLFRFVALQHGRTAGAAMEMQNFVNDAGKKILKAGLEADGDKEALIALLPNVSIKMPDVSLHNILEFSLMAPLLADLRMDLLKTPSTQDFLLGDDPAFITNRYLYGTSGNPRCGFASRGLIVVLPLSPTRAISLCDPGVYKDFAPELTLRQTVEFNLLQARHAVSNVYFRDEAQLVETFARLNSLESFERHHEAKIGISTEDQQKTTWLKNERLAMKLPVEIDIYRLKFSAKRTVHNSKNDLVRDPVKAELIREVMSNPDFLREVFRKE